jgi:putative transposase
VLVAGLRYKPRTGDDRLLCLRLVFLLATRLVAVARLSRRDTAWKNAEILLLRHQLVVVQRQLGERARPKVSWADRALITLLLGLIPASRQHRLRLIVTPGTVLRWRRDILRRRCPLCQDQVRHQGQQLLVELEG